MHWAAWWLAAAMAGGDTAPVEGYVFREADGGPPRRPLTVELVAGGKVVERQRTGRGGEFSFKKGRAGRYVVVARFEDFVIAQEEVTLRAGERNVAAVMTPKRRAGRQPFGTVSAQRLAAQGNKELQKKLRQAGRRAGRGEMEQAARLYEEAVAAGATVEVRDGLGMVYLGLGRREEALRAFEGAIAADPKYLMSYAHLGGVYQQERRWKDLAAVAQRGLDVDPDWMTGRLYLAEAQAGLGQWEAAVKEAEAANRLVRGRAAAPYLVRAKIEWGRRNCAAAVEQMERFLEINTSARGLEVTGKSLAMLRACRGSPAADER